MANVNVKYHKPLYDHSDEMYGMLDSILSVFKSYNANYDVEYANNLMTIIYKPDDMSVFEINLLDMNDDYTDDFMENQFDSNINVAIYRNEQIVARFNGAFTYAIKSVVESIVTL